MHIIGYIIELSTIVYVGGYGDSSEHFGNAQ